MFAFKTVSNCYINKGGSSKHFYHALLVTIVQNNWRVCVCVCVCVSSTNAAYTVCLSDGKSY